LPGQQHARKLSRTTYLGSGVVFLGQRLYIADAPCAVTRTPLQRFDLPQKLAGECRLTAEALIAGFAPQAQVHIAHTRLRGTPEHPQLLSIQVEQHPNLPSRSCGSQAQMLPAL